MLYIKDLGTIKVASRPRGAANLTRADPNIIAAKKAEGTIKAIVIPVKRALAKRVVARKRYLKYISLTKRDPSRFKLI